MSLQRFINKERLIWHKRFIPSLIAGIAVAVITFFFEMTASNIVMFASLGASAAILTHKQIHKLTILRTVIFSYLISLSISGIILFIIHHYTLSFSIAALIAVTLATLTMYLADVFHPPAVSAALAFVLLDGGFWETIVIFFSVIILLIIIKLLTYAFYYEHLEMDKFMQEFKKIEREEKKKWKQMIND
ncbi:HPP family protein [Candidatus Woesearchaeota archaeon]|jgi:CBS-domain-containing membrane protein|nr:HPP family protein [Candidatus Woesearchaeota archaeon]